MCCLRVCLCCFVSELGMLRQFVRLSYKTRSIQHLRIDAFSAFKPL